MKHAIPALLAILLVTALLLWSPSEDRSTAGGAEPPGAAAVAEPWPDLESVAQDARASVRSGAEGEASPRPGSLSAIDLAVMLREVDRAYSAGDIPRLQRALEEIVRDPSLPRRALHSLERGGLRSDPEAQRGAILALVVAIIRYNAPDGLAGVDGRAFLSEILEALPVVLSPEREVLVDQIAEARIGDRRVLDLSWLRTILELRERFPDEREVFSLLLVNLGESLQGTQGFEDFYSLFVGEERDPTIVKVSLSALLQADAAGFLPLAEDLWTRSAGSPELRRAITQAIAASAPVAQAAESLGRLADRSQYAEFSVLGTRPGGIEALQERYGDLVADGGNPTARAMLVSGMHQEKPEMLLGIAATDPDPRVRGQAFLTLTVSHAGSEAMLDEIIRGQAGRQDPATGLPTSYAVSSCANLIRRAGPRLRERARDYLLEIARDDSLADRDRRAAVEAVRPWIDPGALTGIVIGGRVVR